MEEIGNSLLQARESAGISLKEVSEDLDIDEAILTNIEEGKTGAFSDIFVLKEYINNYAKYLGLDSEKLIETFNEYVFTSTSKIPIKEIEKQIIQNKKNEEKEKIVSPYTLAEQKSKSKLYTFLYILFILLFIVACVWSVKQITVSTKSASSISYKD